MAKYRMYIGNIGIMLSSSGEKLNTEELENDIRKTYNEFRKERFFEISRGDFFEIQADIYQTLYETQGVIPKDFAAQMAVMSVFKNREDVMNVLREVCPDIVQMFENGGSIMRKLPKKLINNLMDLILNDDSEPTDDCKDCENKEECESPLKDITIAKGNRIFH